MTRRAADAVSLAEWRQVASRWLSAHLLDAWLDAPPKPCVVYWLEEGGWWLLYPAPRAVIKRGHMICSAHISKLGMKLGEIVCELTCVSLVDW